MKRSFGFGVGCAKTVFKQPMPGPFVPAPVTFDGTNDFFLREAPYMNGGSPSRQLTCVALIAPPTMSTGAKNPVFSANAINKDCLACWAVGNTDDMVQHNAWREAQAPDADLNEDGQTDSPAERKSWWEDALTRT